MPVSIAKLYSLVHRGNAGDVEMYLEACQGARDVLELGCGFGRVLAPLVQSGARVVGLDCDEEMIETARRRLRAEGLEAELVVGDMAHFDLGRTFDRILIPYNGLYCLTELSLQRMCLEAVARHLAPGGELILDVYALADAETGREEAMDEPDWLTTVYEAGYRIAIYERSEWHGVSQRVEAEYTHQIESPDGTVSAVSYSIPQKYLREVELVQLVEQAGLTVTHCAVGFGGGQKAGEMESLQRVLRATPSATK